MFKIALTGGIGCGKSSVCDLFLKLNVPVIDTDIIARDLVGPGNTALLEITNYFGTEILSSDGTLDRKKLAAKIFNSPDDRLFLESILHPKIRQSIQNKIDKLSSNYVIVAIPLLVETNQQTDYDRVIVVDCDEKQQLDRTLARDKRDINEIKSIMNSQVSRKVRISIADDIIDNSLETRSLEEQVNKLHNKFIKLSNTHSQS